MMSQRRSAIPRWCSLQSGRVYGMTGLRSRVTLRELGAADADLIAAWSCDADFCRAAGWSIRPMEQHRAFQRRLIADPPADLLRLAAVQEEGLVRILMALSQTKVSSTIVLHACADSTSCIQHMPVKGNPVAT